MRILDKKLMSGSVAVALALAAFAPYAFGAPGPNTSGGVSPTEGAVPKMSAKIPREKLEMLERNRKQLEDRAEKLQEKAVEINRVPGDGPEFKMRKPEVKNEGPRKDEGTFEDKLQLFRERKDQFEKDKNNLEKRKEALLTIIDAYIAHAERVKQRAVDSHIVNDDLEAAIIARLDAYVAALNELKAKVEGATTASELKAIAAELRDLRKNVGFGDLRKLSVLIEFGKLENFFLKRADDRVLKLEEKLNEPRYKDNSELQSLFAQVKSLIANAHETLRAEKQDVNSLDSIDDIKFKEIVQVLKDVRQEINKIYDILRKIADMMR